MTPPAYSAESAPLRLVVLASGEGSNFQVVLDAIAAGTLRAEVLALVSDAAGAPCLDRARRAGVPALHLSPPPRSGRASPERRAYDALLADRVASFSPDFVLLLGWMRLLTSAFLGRFPGKVINLHPALPKTFPGLHAIERALDAARRGEIENTGVMLHLVPDEGVDCGPLLASAAVPILPDDELADLEGRVHAAEHELVLALLLRLAEERPRASNQAPDGKGA